MLSLVLAYHPDIDLSTVTKAFPGARDLELSIEQLEALPKATSPYAERVLGMVNLDMHQGMVIAPEDVNEPSPEGIDYTPNMYFHVAREGKLTTCLTKMWSFNVGPEPRFQSLMKGLSPTHVLSIDRSRADEKEDPEMELAKRRSLEAAES